MFDNYDIGLLLLALACVVGVNFVTASMLITYMRNKVVLERERQ
ncbi:hypothetical protein [Undibacterium sp. Tian12W]